LENKTPGTELELDRSRETEPLELERTEYFFKTSKSRKFFLDLARREDLEGLCQVGTTPRRRWNNNLVDWLTEESRIRRLRSEDQGETVSKGARGHKKKTD
jgi:hypothetical protein